MVAALAEQRPMEALDKIFDRIDGERMDRMEWVYSLYEVWLRLPNREAKAALLKAVSAEKNISPDRLEGYLQVPERIPWRLLAEAFPGPEGTCTWYLNLTWRHLERAAAAGGDTYTPKQRIEWLGHASDASLNYGKFEDWLRSVKVIKARVTRFTPEEGAKEHATINDVKAAVALIKSAALGEKGQRVQTRALTMLADNQAVLSTQAAMPNTAITLLEAVADDARRRGIDIPLASLPEPGKAYSISKTLRKMAERFDHERPGAEFTIGSPSQGERKE